MATGCCTRASGAGLLLCLWGCGLSAAPAARALGLHRDREQAEARNAEGLARIAQGDFAGAEASFRAALQADPYLGPAHCNLGVALLQQPNKLYEAGWELRYACRLMPRASQPRANLGILYEAVGKYGAAEEELRAALRLAPDDVEIVGHLARIHIRQDKRTPDTVAWLELIASQDDDDAWRGWARGELIRTGNEDSVRNGRN